MSSIDPSANRPLCSCSSCSLPLLLVSFALFFVINGCKGSIIYHMMSDTFSSVNPQVLFSLRMSFNVTHIGCFKPLGIATALLNALLLLLALLILSNELSSPQRPSIDPWSISAGGVVLIIVNHFHSFFDVIGLSDCNFSMAINPNTWSLFAWSFSMDPPLL